MLRVEAMGCQPILEVLAFRRDRSYTTRKFCLHCKIETHFKITIEIFLRAPEIKTCLNSELWKWIIQPARKLIK